MDRQDILAKRKTQNTKDTFHFFKNCSFLLVVREVEKVVVERGFEMTIIHENSKVVTTT